VEWHLHLIDDRYFPSAEKDQGLFTHWASRPACVMVTIILSENMVDVASVEIPSIAAFARLMTAGYRIVEFTSGGESGGIGWGICAMSSPVGIADIDVVLIQPTSHIANSV